MNNSRCNSFRYFLLFFAVSICSVSPAIWSNEDSLAIAHVDRFAKALQQGDVQGVRNALAKNVLIYESGGVEASLEEYASHHMGADMKFLAGMETELLSRHEFTEGNMAVVTTLTRMRGMYRGKTVDNRSTETLVLNRIEGQWKIIHVHWSSR